MRRDSVLGLFLKSPGSVQRVFVSPQVHPAGVGPAEPPGSSQPLREPGPMALPLRLWELADTI